MIDQKITLNPGDTLTVTAPIPALAVVPAPDATAAPSLPAPAPASEADVAAANSIANAILPRTWNVLATIGGTTPSFTFSVGASLIL